jgi:hypothetical protein
VRAPVRVPRPKSALRSAGPGSRWHGGSVGHDEGAGAPLLRHPVRIACRGLPVCAGGRCALFCRQEQTRADEGRDCHGAEDDGAAGGRHRRLRGGGDRLVRAGRHPVRDRPERGARQRPAEGVVSLHRRGPPRRRERRRRPAGRRPAGERQPELRVDRGPGSGPRRSGSGPGSRAWRSTTAVGSPAAWWRPTTPRTDLSPPGLRSGWASLGGYQPCWPISGCRSTGTGFSGAFPMSGGRRAGAAGAGTGHDPAAAAEVLIPVGLDRLLELAVEVRHGQQAEAGQPQHHRRRTTYRHQAPGASLVRVHTPRSVRPRAPHEAQADGHVVTRSPRLMTKSPISRASARHHRGTGAASTGSVAGRRQTPARARST